MPKYNIHIISECDYSELACYKEADLYEIFFCASFLLSNIKSWLKRNVKTNDILDLESSSEWIQNLYNEWSRIFGTCESGEIKKKNAGEISITVLAEILSHYYSNIDMITIYTNDTDCYEYVRYANEKVNERINGIDTPVKISFKSMDVILGQMIREEIIAKENINNLRLDKNRKLKFCQKLSDHSVRELRESVSDDKLITMALDDDYTIIF